MEHQLRSFHIPICKVSLRVHMQVFFLSSLQFLMQCTYDMHGVSYFSMYPTNIVHSFICQNNHCVEPRSH